MHVLVTGATGFIGFHTVMALLKAGHTVAGHYRSWPELGRLLDQVTGRNVRKLSMPGAVVRMMGSVVDLVSRVISIDTLITTEGTKYGTQWVYVDDRKVRNELGMVYRPLEETVADTIRWLADAGHISSYWSSKKL